MKKLRAIKTLRCNRAERTRPKSCKKNLTWWKKNAPVFTYTEKMSKEEVQWAESAARFILGDPSTWSPLDKYPKDAPEIQRYLNRKKSKEMLAWRFSKPARPNLMSIPWRHFITRSRGKDAKKIAILEAQNRREKLQATHDFMTKAEGPVYVQRVVPEPTPSPGPEISQVIESDSGHTFSVRGVPIFTITTKQQM